MPKSINVNEKKINGIQVDKENSSVFFNDESHKYYDKETMEQYISVTTLINQYCNEFDGEFWSAYKALEQICQQDVWFDLRNILLNTKKFKEVYLDKFNIDKKEFYSKQLEIKEQYEKAKNEACEKGTKKHLKKELSFYGKEDFDLTNYNLPEIKGKFTCKQDYYELDLERGIYPEFLISYKFDDLLIAGQIDCLIVDNQDITILDFKTNKEIKKRSYYDKKKKKSVMMKAPLNNLEDSTWNHYQLQLSLYAYLLEHIKPGCNIKKLQLVHIKDDDSETIMECEYLKSDIERMLKHYKRTSKVRMELDKLKPASLLQ